MKTIKLTQGQVAIVDDQDAVWLSQYKWCAQWSERLKGYYAIRKTRLPNGKEVTELMHRRILGLGRDDERDSDHINHDPLDNRRCNLRPATVSQSLHNRGKYRNNTSGHKGIYWHKTNKKWQARIWVDHKCHSLGYFVSKTDAANAYREASKLLLGEFAYNP